MQDSSLAGEIMKRAQMLINSKGQDALEYADMMVESKQKTGDKEDQVYWYRIARQVELLLVEGNYG